MTKEAKSIILKDYKKYQALAEYASEENRDTFVKVTNCLQEILEERKENKWLKNNWFYY